jgi:hypothetical protein
MSFTYGNKNKILYNSCNLREWYDLYCVDDDTTIENQLGASQSANINNGALVNIDKENFAFTLKFIKKVNGMVSSLDFNYLGRPFLDEINRLFFSEKEVNILEIGGRIFYVVPISGTLKRHSQNIGEFSIEFQSLSPYCYSPIILINGTVNTTNSPKEFNLKNNGNETNLLLEVGCISDGNITITNKRNGSSISVLNCKANEEFSVDGESADLKGIGYDRISGNIKDTLTLFYGTSVFNIETTGTFKLNLKYQMEMNVW